MNPEYENLVESYVQWLRNRTQLSDVDGVCEITTPFTDRHNDRIQIYVEPIKSGGYELHDDGYTLSDLELSGCGLTTLNRHQMLHVILNGHGVKVSKDVLSIEATRDNFPQRKHALLQAILTVNDMFMTAKHQVARFFLEDVSNFLDANEVRYIRNVVFNGGSGFPHKFDFVIPRSSKQPERALRVINNPNKDTASNLLFAWMDTRESRPKDSQVYAILNDVDRPLKPDVVDAFRRYEVRTVLWSQREEYAQALVA
ncbi:MAG TPA: DUF1829 domain-containing protein [Pirellulaceae bacterium]|jgi:hypothetical protein|nr:DUF1829 domain-containing protein [Pirellulaceae bacterium]